MTDTNAPVPIGQAMQLAAAKLERVDQLPTEFRPTPISPEDRLRRALRRAGIPERYIDRDLDGFRAVPGTEKAIAAARECVERPRGIVMIGKPGSGKTHLAVGILRALALSHRDTDPTYRGFRSKFVVVPEFLDQLRERIGDSTVPDPLPDLMDAPLVVLDDLGREKPTEWVVDRLYVLINRRYNAMLPTIATSNYPLSELAGRGYEAMMSRLRDSATLITLDAPDYRRAA